jgi:hypothetical protein
MLVEVEVGPFERHRRPTAQARRTEHREEVGFILTRDGEQVFSRSFGASPLSDRSSMNRKRSRSVIESSERLPISTRITASSSPTTSGCPIPKARFFRGGSGGLSHLLGALHLTPLDRRMDRLCKGKRLVHYAGYMDDSVFLARTHW